MVHNFGLQWLKWSLLESPRVAVFLHRIYYTLIDTNEQLMSQRHRIVPPGISSSVALPATVQASIVPKFFESLNLNLKSKSKNSKWLTQYMSALRDNPL